MIPLRVLWAGETRGWTASAGESHCKGDVGLGDEASTDKR